MTRSLTLQRRLRKVQRELEEARLITSFTGDVGMTTEHPPALPAMSSVNDPPQVLAPFSTRTRVLYSAEPLPFAGPQISASYPVPVGRRSPSLLQHLPPAVSLPVDAVSQAATSYPTTEGHPVVQPSIPEHAAPSPPSFHHTALTAPRPARSQRPSDPVCEKPAPLSLPSPTERVSEGASIMELLVATAFGVPKPRLPYFDSGKESDFVLLNMVLENRYPRSPF